MKPRIHWVPWQDPVAAHTGLSVGLEVDEEGLEQRAARATFTQVSQDTGLVGLGQFAPAAVTPFGIVPVREHNLPSRLYQLWVGHTTFDLTEQVARAIEAVPGVESLDIFTRYRLRLGVGLAFDRHEVLPAVERACGAEPEPTNDLAPLRRALGLRYRYWVALVGPDGVSGTAGSDDLDAVQKQLEGLTIPPAHRLVKSWE